VHLLVNEKLWRNFDLVSSVVRTEPKALFLEEKERHPGQSVRTLSSIIQELLTGSAQSVNIFPSLQPFRSATMQGCGTEQNLAELREVSASIAPKGITTNTLCLLNDSLVTKYSVRRRNSLGLNQRTATRLLASKFVPHST
jgi:hypothetical protein